jgi:archaemetzincin
MKILFLVAFSVLISCNSSDTKTEINSKTVGLQPYKGISKSEIDTIANALQNFYHIKTKLLAQKDLPKTAFINIKSPRYRADSIIAIQKRTKVSSLDFILGLTTKDISITKKDSYGSIKKPEWKYNDFGIMGLAYRPGNSAIVSSFRLKNKDKKVQLSRFKKVVIHEFGHNLGLPHCPNSYCVMTSANEKISTIDNEKMMLCEACLKKLN